MADMGGMNAQLMGAAGMGLKLEPGEVLSDLIDHAVMG
ncbi:camphor resistance protein CrcB [Fulvimarina pelagi HTCC2506]|uniref:Camphor resistance protein CrcB n=1 Tax=Fulvimarina pelagi HTCC2506 TaxID=314231 RepID=Q0G6Y1_9HYPH|nr:camphor resistance protein CrcB [Fulvimarina pelagi HTCC2506]